jgi:hypothetical protein
VLTYQEKLDTRHIWKRVLTSERIRLLTEYAKTHVFESADLREWSDLLCLREETIRGIITII